MQCRSWRGAFQKRQGKVTRTQSLSWDERGYGRFKKELLLRGGDRKQTMKIESSQESYEDMKRKYDKKGRRNEED